MSVALIHNPSARDVLLWLGLFVVSVAAAANLLLHDTLFHHRVVTTEAAAAARQTKSAGAEREAAGTVILTEGKWRSAGILSEPARMVALASEVGVTGRIEANTDRRVEIRPRASGVVREVHTLLGQKVKKGDRLAVLDSPDIGTARLNLRGRQIELATVQTEQEWKRQVAANVARLIPELRKGTSATVLEKEYAERPLGSDRALLMQAYTEFEIASHEAEKTGTLLREKIVGEHPAFLAQHTREGAQAKFEGVVEQVRFDAAHQQRIAEQKVKLAEAAVIDAAQRLRILGVSEDVSQLLAAAAEVAARHSSGDEDVTAYPILAPFDGTIITKAAVPSQKAEPNDVLFTLADLQTVWVMANIPESDLAALPSLQEGKIRLAAAAYPGRIFEARLLSVGATVDSATRAVQILAETENPSDILKLGMFVRILFDAQVREDLLTVPAAAVVEIEGKSGVFVPSPRAPRTYAFHVVKAGREADDRRVIVAGLSSGDSVVARGAFFLKSELLLQNELGAD